MTIAVLLLDIQVMLYDPLEAMRSTGHGGINKQAEEILNRDPAAFATRAAELAAHPVQLCVKTLQLEGKVLSCHSNDNLHAVFDKLFAAGYGVHSDMYFIYTDGVQTISLLDRRKALWHFSVPGTGTLHICIY